MKILRPAALFVAIFGFYFLLSLKTELLFVGTGLAVSAILTLFAMRLLDTIRDENPNPRNIKKFAYLRYLGWLLLQIPPAAIAIAKTVITGRAPMPAVIIFDTGLRSPAARTLLANSITVVPGTMTLDVDGPTFVVHAFDPQHATDLITGSLQRRIGRLFSYELDSAPHVEWMPLNETRPAKDPA